MADLALNVVGELLKFLESQAKEEVGLLWNFKGDLKEMEKTLVMLQAVLHDAESRSNKDEAVRLWLAELRDACYDIQDMLDQYMLQFRQQNGHEKIGCVVPVKVCVRSLHSRIVLANEMKSMRERLNKIADSKNKFALKENTVLSTEIIDKNRQTSSASEPMVLGRDKEHDEIVNMIINNVTSQKISVTPIVGMGGLGKTTLAKLIFNDSRLRDSKHFDVWAWAYIGSIEFDLCLVGSRIVSSLRNSEFNSTNEEIINQELKKEVTGKRCLIVLDDVWTINMILWDKLKSMLINSSERITIVVTTRIEKTAKDIASADPYPLNALSENNCILLFQNRAFKSKDEMNKHSNLVKIGEMIAKKCSGVALTAIALGSMLCSQRNETFWLHVRDSEIWQLHNENFLDSSDNTILSGLQLSYNLMPANLKPCFAYCSTYPKGHKISSLKLVQHWISLNFIRFDSSHNSILTLHDIAQIYLDNLISLSFLQRSDKIFDQFGDNVVLMHDLMHDLARHVAKDHDIKIVSDIENIMDANTNSCRYVSIYGLKAASNHSEIDVVDGKVRSISLYSDNVKLKEKSFSHARSLRILEVEGLEINLPKKLKQLCYFSASHIPKDISLPNLHFLHLNGAEFEALPKSVCNFKTLLNLDLSSCRNLSTLPESISNLKNLSYLDLSLCFKLEKLPENFVNLKSLQYLYLFCCLNLATLPESISKLENLSHLDLSHCITLEKLPESFGNLKSLQYLKFSSCQNLANLPESIDNLHKLLHLDLSMCLGLGNLSKCFSNLASLQYLNLSHSRKLTELSESFGNLKNLQYLILHNCENLETLPESIVNLQKLSLLDLRHCSKLRRLPQHFSNLTNLERLELHAIAQVQEYLPELLIDLTSLRHLTVEFSYPPLSTSSMKLIRRLTKFETLRLNLDITIKEEEKDAEEGTCCSIVFLENLNMLEGDLRLRGLEKVKDPKDAERANLKQKHKVNSLELFWNSDELDDEDVDDDHATAVLQNLPPSPKLQCLKIFGYRGRQWPTWTIDQFPLLEKVVIRECPCLNRISLPPSTKKLYLEDNVGLLLSPAGTIEASSLVELHVQRCEQLVALLEYIGKLSCLKHISIYCCRNLQSLPNSMRLLTQLQSLIIHLCSKAFKEDCNDPKSDNWSRTQHISNVVINAEGIGEDSDDEDYWRGRRLRFLKNITLKNSMLEEIESGISQFPLLKEVVT